MTSTTTTIALIHTLCDANEYFEAQSVFHELETWADDHNETPQGFYEALDHLIEVEQATEDELNRS